MVEKKKFRSWALIFLGLLVGVGLAFAAGWTLGYREQSQHDHSAAYYSAARADATNTCLELEGQRMLECIEHKIRSAYQANHDERDLQAQQISASSTLGSAITGVVALVVSIIGLWIVKRTLDATQRAVEESSKATNAMLDANRIAGQVNRPWIEVDISITSPLMIRAPQPFSDEPMRAEVGLMVYYKNVGSAPAVEVSVLYDVLMVQDIFFSDDDLDSIRRNLNSRTIPRFMLQGVRYGTGTTKSLDMRRWMHFYLFVVGTVKYHSHIGSHEYPFVRIIAPRDKAAQTSGQSQHSFSGTLDGEVKEDDIAIILPIWDQTNPT